MRRSPLPDELFSTWLLRNARAHADTAYSFCKAVWGNGSFWARDVDRSVSSAVVAQLAGYTQTSLERAKLTSLRLVYGELLPPWRVHGISPWVLQVGVYHRTRTRYGQQFCPLCLAEDREPYFRLTWRLALVFLCLKHGCLLQDQCLCGAPVVLHAAPDLQLARCGRCSRDLRSSQPKHAPALADLQEALLSVLQGGQIVRGGAELSASQYLDGLRVMVCALGRPGAARRLLAHFRPALAESLPMGTAPETGRVQARADSLQVAAALLEMTRSDFLALCRDAGCTYHTFEGRQTMPAWLHEVLADLPLMRRQRQRQPRRLGRDPARLSWNAKLATLNAQGGWADFADQRARAMAALTGEG